MRAQEVVPGEDSTAEVGAKFKYPRLFQALGVQNWAELYTGVKVSQGCPGDSKLGAEGSRRAYRVKIRVLQG